MGIEVAAFGKEESDEKEILPNEDLMREHGVLRRILLIYKKVLSLFKSNEELALNSLAQSAAIIRSFIEDYHEKLEEDYLFPRFRKAGKLVDLADTLYQQHNAARKLTDIILNIGNNPDDFDRLSNAISSFIIVYEPHAAREDTVLFPAFREIINADEYNELGEIFEQQEHQLFGENGFQDTVKKVESIEKRLGIYDLAQFTPKMAAIK